MDRPDAGYPRLYRAASLMIRPTPNFFAGGEYHDEHGLRVGRFDVTIPTSGRWGDHRAREVTEILDGDETVFMVVVHRGRDFVMFDPDGTELAALRPNAQVLGRRIRVRVTLADHGAGSLRERRMQDGARTYSVSFGSGPPTARLTGRIESTEICEITLTHDGEASPPQRCASLALATCLRQMIVIGPVFSGGASYG
jgi:hypothetical protein